VINPDTRTIEALRFLKSVPAFGEVVRWFAESQKETHLSMEGSTGEILLRHAGEAVCIRRFLDEADRA
jgi:hypothetical protein